MYQNEPPAHAPKRTPTQNRNCVPKRQRLVRSTSVLVTVLDGGKAGLSSLARTLLHIIFQHMPAQKFPFPLFRFWAPDQSTASRVPVFPTPTRAGNETASHRKNSGWDETRPSREMVSNNYFGLEVKKCVILHFLVFKLFIQKTRNGSFHCSGAWILVLLLFFAHPLTITENFSWSMLGESI